MLLECGHSCGLLLLGYEVHWRRADLLLLILLRLLRLLLSLKG